MYIAAESRMVIPVYFNASKFQLTLKLDYKWCSHANKLFTMESVSSSPDMSHGILRGLTCQVFQGFSVWVWHSQGLPWHRYYLGVVPLNQRKHSLRSFFLIMSMCSEKEQNWRIEGTWWKSWKRLMSVRTVSKGSRGSASDERPLGKRCQTPWNH